MKKDGNIPKLFETFTKLWVTILLIVGLVDLQLSYFLAYMGHEQIAESLSIAVVTEILGVSVAYIIRAHFDTKAEKNQELQRDEFEMGLNSGVVEVIDDDEPIESDTAEEIDADDQTEG